MTRFPDESRFSGANPNRRFDTRNEPSRAWSPAVDVSESATEIVLHVEIPGVSKDAIEIELHGDTLSLRGARPREKAGRAEHFHRVERRHGAWARTFQLQAPLDAARISATYEAGVLCVRLPKLAAAPRPIQIQEP